jgi:hypothetical protein
LTHPVVDLLAAEQVPQRVGGFDAYDLGSALLALSSGLALAVRRLGRGTLDRHSVDELLLALVVIGTVILVLHQVVTDGLCHGACQLSVR